MEQCTNPYGLPDDVFREIQLEAKKAAAAAPPWPPTVLRDLQQLFGLKIAN